MSFNSIEFLIFFPIVLALYYASPFKYRWAVLLAASYYFYMAWRPVYVLLLLAATIIAYVGGLAIVRTSVARERKGILVASLLLLLGILFVYKYFNFFNDTLRALASYVDMGYGIPSIDLILPLGISFFTFQKVAYLVDVYQGKIPAERHFGRFALFASFFPQLVAGPIERAKNLIPELYKNVRFDYDEVASGVRLMAWGFFKKIVVADQLAPFVNTVYGSPQQYDGISLMTATFFFAFQVYCDFSAYSDIAIGAARTMGVKLMDNFRQPYFSTSISEFWKRWHISLSTWLTDYVYTPLTRAKSIKLKWYPKFLLSLFVTFLVSGLWHGAAWTFVAWGTLHGTYLICSMLTQNVRKRFVAAVGLAKVPRLHTFLRIVMTFSLVCLSYIFFRANSLSDAMYIVTHLFSGSTDLGNAAEILSKMQVTGDAAGFLIAVLGIGVVLAFDGLVRYGLVKEELGSRPVWVRWPAYYALVCATVLLGAFYGNVQSFIYFQF